MEVKAEKGKHMSSYNLRFFNMYGLLATIVP